MGSVNSPLLTRRKMSLTFIRHVAPGNYSGHGLAYMYGVYEVRVHALKDELSGGLFLFP
jgi:hypothetical protein